MTIKERLFEYIIKNFKTLTPQHKNKIGEIFYHFLNKDFDKANLFYIELLKERIVSISDFDTSYKRLTFLFMESLTNIENLRDNLLQIGYKETTVDLTIKTFTKNNPQSCIEVYKAISNSSSKFKKEAQNLIDLIDFINKEIKNIKEE